MPDRAKRSSEADRAAIVGRFDRAAEIFDGLCPKGTIRLPSPREGMVMVEIDLASFERIMGVVGHAR